MAQKLETLTGHAETVLQRLELLALGQEQGVGSTQAAEKLAAEPAQPVPHFLVARVRVDGRRQR